ncbi:unnamed protein product [Wuchereria bancrofti]|uniref:Uncharacterized protein n=1 Tax=Wuchereria bancrofti TaxID=6293 RepID=A0A3P7E4I5_WUCBA|nr:unnamed protein product [Wuchereria bancrofti]
MLAEIVKIRRSMEKVLRFYGAKFAQFIVLDKSLRPSCHHTQRAALKCNSATRRHVTKRVVRQSCLT